MNDHDKNIQGILYYPKEDSHLISRFKKLKEKLDNLYWKHHRQWYLKFKNQEDEEFKPITDYQGLYFVSNYGQVVSFHKKSPACLAYSKKNGFFTVSLRLDGPQRLHYVHELVFNHFVGRQSGRRVVHKNGDTTDNHYRNLRSAKPSEKSRRGFSRPKVHPILQFDKEGKFIRQYASIREASRAVRVSDRNISQCIKRKGKSAGGYQWRSGSDPRFSRKVRDIDPLPPRNSDKARTILQFHRNGKFIREYPSISGASRELKIDVATIVECARGKLHTAGGYQWYYRDHPFFNFGINNVVPIPKIKSPHRKTVLQFDLDGNFIKEYPSLWHATRAVGLKSSGLNSCLKGKTWSAGGYQWRYKSDPLFKDGIVKLPSIIHRKLFKPKPVLQFNKQGKFLRKFPSIYEAMRISGVSNGAIVRCIQGKRPLAGGYQWRWQSDLLKVEGKKGKRKAKKIKNIEPVKEVPPLYQERPVFRFSLEGKFIKEYPSIREAERKTGINSIHGALTNAYKTAGGCQWRYKDDPLFKNGIIDIPPVSSKRSFSTRNKQDKPISYDYSTPVLQFDKEGIFLREYPSLIEAELASRINRQHIVQCTRGKEKCAGGFQWRYKNDPMFKNGICNLEPAKMDYFTIPVLQFDFKGNYIAEYPSYAEASRAVGVNATSISNCARGINYTAAGYQWRLKNDPMFKKGIVNIPPLKKVTGTMRKDILQFDRKGKFIRQYPSKIAAARDVNRSVRTIQAAVFKQCKSAAGYQWRSINDPLFENGIVDIEPLEE
ncbi:MAG: hypothetical protein JSV88_18375 [Candidatus Aminicenantes bacterium]|nr:MAG: hypothetical protein JSV88_18375 [Candidatus Aminicenantes bacterium]